MFQDAAHLQCIRDALADPHLEPCRPGQCAIVSSSDPLPFTIFCFPFQSKESSQVASLAGVLRLSGVLDGHGGKPVGLRVGASVDRFEPRVRCRVTA